LSEHELHGWRTFVQAHERLINRLDDALTAHTSLTLAEYEVMVHLSESPEWRKRMNELAEECNLSPSGLTRRFDSMVRSGLVERARCDADRRGVFAVLTAKGYELLVRAAPTHVDSVRRYFLDLLEPGELDLITAVFQRVGTEPTPERVMHAPLMRVPAGAQR